MHRAAEQTLTAPLDERQERSCGFSHYQSLLVALLVQFTIIIDIIDVPHWRFGLSVD